MGKKNGPRGFFGWNLLEIVDDNAASCVYIGKKHTFLPKSGNKKINFDKAFNLLSFYLDKPN